jgi:hypothetical protein
MLTQFSVTPVKAGVQLLASPTAKSWIPAFAGWTGNGRGREPRYGFVNRPSAQEHNAF